MKRIIVSTMALLIMLVSIAGCWPWWYGPGGPHGRGGYDRGGHHEGSGDHHQGHR